MLINVCLCYINTIEIKTKMKGSGYIR